MDDPLGLQDDWLRDKTYAKGLDDKLERYTLQGTWLKCEVNNGKDLMKKPPERGPTVEISPHARLRILSTFSRINWRRSIPAVFVTLTYPDEYNMAEKDVITRHRNNFKKRVERSTGKPLIALWRTEWLLRKSGAMEGKPMPHVHMLAFKQKFLPFEVVNGAWKANFNVPYIRTEVERARSIREAGGYVSKYVAKVSQGSLVIAAWLAAHPQGNMWGILNRNLVPWATRHQIIVRQGDVPLEVRQTALEARPTLNDYGNESFTLLGGRARQVGAIIFGNAIDGDGL